MRKITVRDGIHLHQTLCWADDEGEGLKTISGQCAVCVVSMRLSTIAKGQTPPQQMAWHIAIRHPPTPLPWRHT